MPCYSPLKAYRNGLVNKETGKEQITFSRSEANIRSIDDILKLPCGQCLGCRLERSRIWAVRCVLEADLYDENCFITLTYNNQNLPKNGSLDKTHFQKFMKRLRKNTGKKIRYFMCGEYGKKVSRPHYHAIIFNYDFPDKQVWNYDKKIGVFLYRSESLEKLWPYGFSTIGNVTFESSAYVARYILKKVSGLGANAYYHGRDKEYTCMSRKPGIASDWYDIYKTDVYPDDNIIIRNNIKTKPPRFFDEKYLLTNPEDYEKIKLLRKEYAKANPHNSPKRREEVSEIMQKKVKRLERRYESDSTNIWCL